MRLPLAVQLVLAVASGVPPTRADLFVRLRLRRIVERAAADTLEVEYGHDLDVKR